jgi:hypothetical protein
MLRRHHMASPAPNRTTTAVDLTAVPDPDLEALLDRPDLTQSSQITTVAAAETSPSVEPASELGAPGLGPSFRQVIGYVAERSTHHVAGWVYDPSDVAERVAFDVVLTGSGTERVLARGRAAQYSAVASAHRRCRLCIPHLAARGPD